MFDRGVWYSLQIGLSKERAVECVEAKKKEKETSPRESVENRIGTVHRCWLF